VAGDSQQPHAFFGISLECRMCAYQSIMTLAPTTLTFFTSDRPLYCHPLLASWVSPFGAPLDTIASHAFFFFFLKSAVMLLLPQPIANDGNTLCLAAPLHSLPALDILVVLSSCHHGADCPSNSWQAIALLCNHIGTTPAHSHCMVG